MAVDVAEIKRVIDDFDMKARKKHDLAEKYFLEGKNELATAIDYNAHAYEYCAGKLRLVLQNV